MKRKSCKAKIQQIITMLFLRNDTWNSAILHILIFDIPFTFHFFFLFLKNLILCSQYTVAVFIEECLCLSVLLPYTKPCTILLCHVFGRNSWTHQAGTTSCNALLLACLTTQGTNARSRNPFSAFPGFLDFFLLHKDICSIGAQLMFPRADIKIQNVLERINTQKTNRWYWVFFFYFRHTS